MGLKWIIIIIIIIATIITSICWMYLRIAIWNSCHFSSCSRLIRGLWSRVFVTNPNRNNPNQERKTRVMVDLLRIYDVQVSMILLDDLYYIWKTFKLILIFLVRSLRPLNYRGLILLPSSACNLFLHDCHFIQLQKFLWGTRWRSWLRHCATSRKVAVSILDRVIRIFHWHIIISAALWPWDWLSL